MNKILRLTFVALLALVSNMGFAADKEVTIDIFHDGVKLFGLKGISTNDSNDGDFTEAKTATVDGVSLTVSASTSTTANRLWSYYEMENNVKVNGVQLRFYGGTLKFESKDNKIKKIVFVQPSNEKQQKWSDMAVDNGIIAKQTYTNDKGTNAVTFTLDGKSKQCRINSVVVTVDASATGISSVESKQQPSARYNLAGQKVGTDYKGVVIENGKKMVVK